MIIHVHDVSHESYEEQRKHVEQTLKSLLQNSPNEDNEKLLASIINVGNKCDLIDETRAELHKTNNLSLISSKTLTGIEDLQFEVEKRILVATQRRQIIIKVPMGGSEASWLYKNAAVTETTDDPKNPQNLLLNVVISEAKLQQFRHHFVKR